eukprot:6688768-Alexandrium_andersonii.AAC.1
MPCSGNWSTREGSSPGPGQPTTRPGRLTYVRRSWTQAPRALIAQAWGTLQQAKARFHHPRYAYTGLAGLGRLCGLAGSL